MLVGIGVVDWLEVCWVGYLMYIKVIVVDGEMVVFGSINLYFFLFGLVGLSEYMLVMSDVGVIVWM